MNAEAARKVGSAEGGKLAHAMGEWLNARPWWAWCTLTFDPRRYPEITEEASTRAYQQLLDYMRSQGSPHVTWFMGHEHGRLNGHLHLHGLLGNVADYTSRTALWKWWHRRWGRAQFLRYDPLKGATYYVSKYVTKELAAWDFDLTGLCVPRTPSLLDSLRPSACDTTQTTRPRRPSGGRA